MKTELKQKIDSLISENPVLLFMKGTKERPQCGFSKQVVQVLNQLVSDYTTVDILVDPEMREAIKVYSSWPTIPQLYIHGEFIGGCDIVLDLQQKNQLQDLLKLEKASVKPTIKVSESALKAFANAQKDAGEDAIRLSIAANFEHSLSFDRKSANDFELAFDGFNIIIDPYSALRSENLEIDFQSDHLEAGFSFNNPNLPPEVKDLSVEELKAWRDQGHDALLIDVRPKDEWQLAHINFAKLLTEVSEQKLDKEQKIVFHCHHGGRSMRMAERFRLKGFKNIYNLTGGIDAWSKKIDNSVPTY